MDDEKLKIISNKVRKITVHDTTFYGAFRNEFLFSTVCQHPIFDRSESTEVIYMVGFEKPPLILLES